MTAGEEGEPPCGEAAGTDGESGRRGHSGLEGSKNSSSFEGNNYAETWRKVPGERKYEKKPDDFLRGEAGKVFKCSFVSRASLLAEECCRARRLGDRRRSYGARMRGGCTWLGYKGRLWLPAISEGGLSNCDWRRAILERDFLFCRKI